MWGSPATLHSASATAVRLPATTSLSAIMTTASSLRLLCARGTSPPNGQEPLHDVQELVDLDRLGEEGVRAGRIGGRLELGPCVGAYHDHGYVLGSGLPPDRPQHL